MAILRKRKIGKKNYYYIKHTYKVRGKVKTLSKYIGMKKPPDIDKLKKKIELEVMRKVWKKPLSKIKNGFLGELKRLPRRAVEKKIESFMVNFIYNSDKIEGSKLSFKDTVGLFLHGTTPKNKPLRDVKEAEGHRSAFYDMLNHKEGISLKRTLQWHKMIFENSDPDIAGKIRLHEIIVTGSRTVFPLPKDLNKLLNGFFLWYNKTKDKYDPIEFSALVHLKFVTIHPFTDGNGRISRLLANYVMYRNKYPMFNIEFGDRKTYYSNLERSQLWNDAKHFVRFFVRKYINSNKEYLR